MQLESALAAPRGLVPPSKCRQATVQGLWHPGVGKCLLVSYSHDWRLTVTPLKLPTVKHFGEAKNLTAYLHKLSETLRKSLPEPVKEFPWKKATDLVYNRLLHLGKNALKWFLVGFLCINFLSDAIFSFSRNMELTIPLGLFIGLTVADFLAETSRALLHGTSKDLSFGKQLLGIATIFACTRIATPYVALPGRLILVHISNGGMMQALWSATELQSTKDENDVESSLPKLVEA